MFRILLSACCVLVLLQAIGQSVDTTYLRFQLDSIIQDGLDSMAFPGAQVCVMIGG
ncbi:MAG: hypothetical protein HKN68_08620, partial [Saprospiraceae bacterium]|nr:hypothetical protein [Saprospiraceae bacterium]